jgi:uncharacterized membrane protein
MLIRKIFTAFFITLLFLGIVTSVKAQEAFDKQPFEETLEGTVVEIIKEKEIITGGEKHLYQELKVSITKGSLKDQAIVVKSGEVAFANIPRYEEGDRLIINYTKDFEGNDLFYITDYVRRNALLWLFVIFVILAVAVGKVWGITSILGMGFSFLVIFKFILPQIINGADPVFIAIVGSIFIIPVTFYLSHGFNSKTHIAMIGTFIAIIITGLLAATFVEVSKLTGFASEEAGFLQFEKQGLINMKGLLLAGIIIGTLGILDDVTVSQSAIVFQLREANKKLGPKRLYNQAMKVGHDHVSSMVNTLVLVYTGAALPLLLLFINNPRPFSEVINYEIIADEIVRTLVGSIGLILAVPITTFLAAYYYKKR